MERSRGASSSPRVFSVPLARAGAFPGEGSSTVWHCVSVTVSYSAPLRWMTWCPFVKKTASGCSLAARCQGAQVPVCQELVWGVLALGSLRAPPLAAEPLGSHRPWLGTGEAGYVPRPRPGHKVATEAGAWGRRSNTGSGSGLYER